MNKKTILSGVVILSVLGCGGESAPSDAARFASFQVVGQQMTNEVTSYRTETTTIPDHATCQDWAQHHAQAMNGMLDRMQGMGGWFDDHLAGTAPADLQCVVAAMQAQMAWYGANACTAPDASGWQPAAAQHACTMYAFMQHQSVRYQQCGDHMGMMGAASAQTFTCVQNGDGSFTLNGQPWAPGTLPSGVTCGAGGLPAGGCDWPSGSDGGQGGMGGGMGSGGMAGMP